MISRRAVLGGAMTLGAHKAVAAGLLLGVAPLPPGSDIILIAGQSNAEGEGHYVSQISDPTDPRITQLPDGSAGPAILASDPLSSPGKDLNSDTAGFAVSFSRSYLPRIQANRGLLLVPAAVSATNIGQWVAPGSDPTVMQPALMENAIAQTLRALALNAGNRFVGLLWHQGEADAGTGDLSWFGAALHQLISVVRYRLNAPNAWFILGGMSPPWVAANPSTTNVLQGILADTPNRETRCAYWAGGAGNVGDVVNNIHYSAAEQVVNGASGVTAGIAKGLF